MGNRAIITWDNVLGVYVHWNGGEESIRPFLKYCELHNFRSPSNDEYGLARFVQVVSNFFGNDGLGIGVGFVGRMDDSDNGVYRCREWRIIGRSNWNGAKLYYPPLEVLKAINEKQPKDMRLDDKTLEKGAKEIEKEHKAAYAERE